MARYLGLWHGGINYSDSTAEDAETFDSIGQAADAMRDRRDRGYWQPQNFRYVFRAPSSDLTPNAHDDHSGGIDLFGPFDGDPSTWDADTREGWTRYLESGDGPDIRLTFGPRGGIRRNA